MGLKISGVSPLEGSPALELPDVGVTGLTVTTTSSHTVAFLGTNSGSLIKVSRHQQRQPHQGESIPARAPVTAAIFKVSCPRTIVKMSYRSPVVTFVALDDSGGLVTKRRIEGLMSFSRRSVFVLAGSRSYRYTDRRRTTDRQGGYLLAARFPCS